MIVSQPAKWLKWKKCLMNSEEFYEQQDIKKHMGGVFGMHAHATVADEVTEHMVSSLDNLALATVHRNNTVEK